MKRGRAAGREGQGVSSYKTLLAKRVAGIGRRELSERSGRKEGKEEKERPRQRGNRKVWLLVRVLLLLLL